MGKVEPGKRRRFSAPLRCKGSVNAEGKPATLACMHGSAWKGDGEKLLRTLTDRLGA